VSEFKEREGREFENVEEREERRAEKEVMRYISS